MHRNCQNLYDFRYPGMIQYCCYLIVSTWAVTGLWFQDCRSKEPVDHECATLRQQRAPLGEYCWLRSERGLLCPLRPLQGVQHHLRVWYRRVWDSHRDQGAASCMLLLHLKQMHGFSYLCLSRPLIVMPFRIALSIVADLCTGICPYVFYCSRWFFNVPFSGFILLCV